MHNRRLFSLDNKIILVTGGAGLYGQFIVEGLAEAGARVIAASRDLPACQKLALQLQQNGLQVFALKVDQREHHSIIDLRQQIKEQFGGLDVFVNNAVSRPMRRYQDPMACWAESMQVNATGMFDLLREMADLIQERGGGVIVNIGSMQGVYGPDFNLYEETSMDSPPDYHFHKGGLIALTRYLARKLGPLGIRVNCLSPGGLFDGQPDTFVARYIRKVPLGRMACGTDIKGPVVFLASDASAYFSGENLVMDGGMHA